MILMSQNLLLLVYLIVCKMPDHIHGTHSLHNKNVYLPLIHSTLLIQPSKLSIHEPGQTDLRTANMITLNFITSNKNKLSEVRAILGDAVVVDNKSVDVPEIQGTIEEIAKEKCRRAADEVCVPLADGV